MGAKFEHDELAFYVDTLDSMLRLEKFFPQKEGVARSYTMPYEDSYGETVGWYGTIQITEQFMVLIEFETLSVISFGLFQRKRVGEFPKEIFRKLIGRPVEDPYVERSKLLGITRMRVLGEMVEILQTALHDEETLTKLPEDFLKLRMPLVLGSQSTASYLNEAEAKLGRSDPKYGGLIFGIALWSAFLLWI